MTTFDAMVAAYMPRMIASFDCDPDSYELTADGLTELLEGAAESYNEDDPDSENLLLAAGYVSKATQADGTGERFCGYITRILDEILASRGQS